MAIIPKEYVYNTQIVSKKAYEDHVTLYKGYVNKINEIDQKLITDPQDASANATYSHYRGLKEGETYAIDAAILHELYFDNLGSVTMTPNLKVSDILKKSFGSYSLWAEDFTACAKAARGWTVLVYEQRTNSFRNILLDNHNTGIIVAAFPIVVLDMYEHAYMTDYAINKEAYIKKFLEFVDWDVAASRMAKLYNEL